VKDLRVFAHISLLDPAISEECMPIAGVSPTSQFYNVIQHFSPLQEAYQRMVSKRSHGILGYRLSRRCRKSALSTLLEA
jgi:hypothetical protein